ncbi:hypothetical protein TNCV_793551 [Trichonephila clavipes]|nr:hypothetical protein TNCV_793551 [Trichonephila clavipes]
MDWQTRRSLGSSQYEREYSTEVKICGLFVDKDKPFLCASPDGLVDKPNRRNRGEREPPFFRGGCVQSSIIHVRLDIFG